MIALRVMHDTNILIRNTDLAAYSTFLLSAVVLQELTAGANDDKHLRELEGIKRRFEERGQFLVPTGEDWYAAGRILNLLWRGRKSRRYGKVSAIPKEEQQRLLRDVLIARTALRAGATLVTENLRDFDKIRRYCDVRTIHPDEFF